MKHTKQNRYRKMLRSSNARTASFLTVALVTTLLTFTPTNSVTADETTPNTTSTNTETSSNTDMSSDSGSDAGSPLDPSKPSTEPSIPGTNPSLPAIEPTDDESISDSGQSGSELGLPIDPSGQPTPTPVGTENTETPVPFGSVTGGTWNGVTWEIRDDNNPGVDYELYLGNPNGTTPQTFTPTIILDTAPWWTNATYKANITEVNIRGPVKAPNSLERAFHSFVKLEAWNDLSTTPGVAFFDTSAVTNMTQLFVRCYSLRDIEGLRYWKTDNVTNMHETFALAMVSSFEAIEGWTTNNLTNAFRLFLGNPNLERIDLSGWNLMNIQNNPRGTSSMEAMFEDCPNLRVITLGSRSRLWPNYAQVPDALGGATANVVSFLTEGYPLEEKQYTYDPTAPTVKYLEPSPLKYMGQWQEVGTGTVDDPNGVVVGTGVQLMQRSLNAAQRSGTYVWRPKFEVKLDGNGGKWAALNPNTGQPAENAFLYVPRPAAAVGGPYQSVNLTSPNPITTLPANLPSGFYGWTTTPDLLSSKVTKVTPTNNTTVVYALWSKLEFIDSPDAFDFGSKGTSRLNRTIGLDPTSPSYTPADVTNGFDLTVGSNALLKWEVTASLDPFTDSATGMVVLPGLVGLDITGMTHKEQTSPPATQLPVFNPNISLPADGVTSQVVAGSGNNALAGGGVWEINIPFNNVKLNLPPINNTYLGSWESTLTWSLEDLP